MAKTAWTETVSAEAPIRGAALVELRTAIRNELSRRKLGALAVTDATPSGVMAKAVHVTELTEQFSKIKTQGNFGAVKDVVVAASTLTLLREAVNTAEVAPAQGGSGGCNAACTGLCQSCTGSCTGSCTSCTGCSGTCRGSCSGCSGTCTGSCTGCSGTCTGGCSTTCTGTCSGDCTGDCTNTCSGDCTGGCTNICANDCITSCLAGCVIHGGG